MRMHHGDAADLVGLVGPGTVDCIVTSPPYNTGMPYPGVEDLLPVHVYQEQTVVWAEQMAAVLRDGGRCWVNVPPTVPVEGRGSGPRWSPMRDWMLSLDMAGLEYRDVVSWHQDVPDAATKWGSWMSPNAPNLRGRWEAVLVFSKARWPRQTEGPTGHSMADDGVDPAEFVAWTRNVWPIPPERRTKGGHPCPFPAELARRAVLLSTFPGDLVCDPFAGSGTVLRVAQAYGRRGVGVDLSREYVEAFQTEVAV